LAKGNKSKGVYKEDVASINTLRKLTRKAEQVTHTQQSTKTSSGYPVACRYNAS